MTRIWDGRPKKVGSILGKCQILLSFCKTSRPTIGYTASYATDTRFFLSGVKQPQRDGKSKGIPWQAEVALGVPGRLRTRIFSTFSTTRLVGRQPNAPAAFTPGEFPGTHFQRLSRPQGAWFCQKEPRKKSQVTPPGIDPGTFRLIPQRLNHYATPGPTSV